MVEADSNPLKIVDISRVDEKTARELLDAATTQGFLFIEGHGFSQDEVDKLFSLSKEFFELPQEYKDKYPIKANNNGYTSYGGENLDPDTQKKGDPKEALNFSEINFVEGLSKDMVPDWFLEERPRYDLVNNTVEKLYDLSIKILRILAIGLQIEDTSERKGSEWFTDRYAPDKASGTTFRFLHYPGQKSLSPEAVIRAGAHTDYGSMTLLFQKENQEGLEIYSPVFKKWQAVPFVPSDSDKFEGQAPPIVVNIADQLSYWTGGLLKSTIHRVKFPAKVQESGQDRYSIVFFSHPCDNTLLTPVPSPVVREREGRGANNASSALTAKEHLDKRLANTYGWSY